MKAIVCAKYGQLDGLKFEEVQKPIMRDNEVLVKVYASSVNFNSLAHVKGKPFATRLWFGFLKPKNKIPGNDIAGRVESVGRNIKQFQSGDEVFGESSGSGFGAFAEYTSVPQNTLSLKPANISFEEAAAVPEAALVALQALRGKGKIRAGQKVLIYGASGGIGTFAVQIAKSFGTEVTAVCSTRNIEIVRSIGADHVVDYTKEDFTKNDKLYDLILAAQGYRSIFDYKHVLNPGGIYVCTGGSGAQILQALLIGPWISMTGNKKMGNMMAIPSQKDLIFIKELIEAGKIKPVIDRYYPLSDAAEALRYYGEGHARGKVVMKVEHKNKA